MTYSTQFGATLRAGAVALGLIALATPALAHSGVAAVRLDAAQSAQVPQYEFPDHGPTTPGQSSNQVIGGAASPAGTGGGAGGDGGSGSITEHTRPRGNPASPVH